MSFEGRCPLGARLHVVRPGLGAAHPNSATWPQRRPPMTGTPPDHLRAGRQSCPKACRSQRPQSKTAGAGFSLPSRFCRFARLWGHGAPAGRVRHGRAERQTDLEGETSPDLHVELQKTSLAKRCRADAAERCQSTEHTPVRPCRLERRGRVWRPGSLDTATCQSVTGLRSHRRGERARPPETPNCRRSVPRA